LRGMCARLDQFEHDLAQLEAQSIAVAGLGEALMADCRALAGPGAPRTEPDDQHRANSGDEGGDESDRRALDRLIDAQRAEIASLHEQLTEAEESLERRGQPAHAPLPSAGGTIPLHDVREFVQDSPMASRPAETLFFDQFLKAASAPPGQKVPMGSILTRAGLVSERQLERALDYQRRGRRQPLATLLADLGYITEEAVAQALAAQLDLPYVVLANQKVDALILKAVPVHLARRHAIFPTHHNGRALCVAMANPLDLIAIEDLRFATGQQINPSVALRNEIFGHIDRHYG